MDENVSGMITPKRTFSSSLLSLWTYFRLAILILLATLITYLGVAISTNAIIVNKNLVSVMMTICYYLFVTVAPIVIARKRYHARNWTISKAISSGFTWCIIANFLYFPIAIGAFGM